ncbi:MAG: alpha/beta hydrolase, partial [Lachnospiraceae bacterium]|nr:alpha/beta hydrolase [Lachnospiraceae bacterium]
MEFQIQELPISGMTCRLYLPSDYNEGEKHYPTIYVNGEIPIEEIMTKLVNIRAETDFILLSVKPESWNDDFTPWTAPAFRKGEEAPMGKADAYLKCLTKEIKPYMDAHYRTKPEPEHTA